MTMDARKQRVLQAIVALYGLEGEPVGSSVLANYFDMAVSSATLRNEMAALTKLGLLEQPHTSAVTGKIKRIFFESRNKFRQSFYLVLTPYPVWHHH